MPNLRQVSVEHNRFLAVERKQVVAGAASPGVAASRLATTVSVPAPVSTRYSYPPPVMDPNAGDH